MKKIVCFTLALIILSVPMLAGAEELYSIWELGFDCTEEELIYAATAHGLKMQKCSNQPNRTPYVYTDIYMSDKSIEYLDYNFNFMAKFEYDDLGDRCVTFYLSDDIVVLNKSISQQIEELILLMNQQFGEMNDCYYYNEKDKNYVKIDLNDVTPELILNIIQNNLPEASYFIDMYFCWGNVYLLISKLMDYKFVSEEYTNYNYIDFSIVLTNTRHPFEKEKVVSYNQTYSSDEDAIFTLVTH